MPPLLEVSKKIIIRFTLLSLRISLLGCGFLAQISTSMLMGSNLKKMTEPIFGKGVG